ncbi:MAG TPA: SMI1/KNR4 family protein [Gemmataceae bacterium]|nr:SMI1/KNR4 family protein [Gemmataceae bacterium]
MDNYDKIVESVAATLVAKGLARPSELVGCTEDEIRQLEEGSKFRLPAAYRSFLARMGKSAGRMFVGSDAFFDILVQVQAWTQDMLAEAGHPGIIPPDAFTFLMHGGYIVLFFRTSEGDDPLVYRLNQSDTVSIKIADRFSEFLVAEADRCVAMRAMRAEFRKKHGLDERK